MRNYIVFAGFLLLLGGMSIGLGSCKKKGDTIVKIIVKDTSNALVPGAKVILYGTSTEMPAKPVIRRDTSYTNSAGVAVFNYNDVYQLGQAGVAILNIIASKDGHKGEGIIKVEQETESITEVYIQP